MPARRDHSASAARAAGGGPFRNAIIICQLDPGSALGNGAGIEMQAVIFFFNLAAQHGLTLVQFKIVLLPKPLRTKMQGWPIFPGKSLLAAGLNVTNHMPESSPLGGCTSILQVVEFWRGALRCPDLLRCAHSVRFAGMRKEVEGFADLRINRMLLRCFMNNAAFSPVLRSRGQFHRPHAHPPTRGRHGAMSSEKTALAS